MNVYRKGDIAFVELNRTEMVSIGNAHEAREAYLHDRERFYAMVRAALTVAVYRYMHSGNSRVH